MGVLRRAITPALAPLARVLSRARARIAMFHRLAPAPAFRRISVESFEWRINHLRRHYAIVPLAELVRRLREGAPLGRCVAITFDDGHRDFLECAYPVLEKHRVPVTVYLVSSFTDQRIWLWSDAIHWLVSNAREGRYRLDVGAQSLEVRLDGQESSNALWERLADHCLTMTAQARSVALARLAEQLGVRLPAQPAAAYAGMRWDELRTLDPNLVDFGAHTCSHPILSLCTQEEQRDEIEGCRARIEGELQRRIESFCYPNGQEGDFNADTLRILRRAGFTSAVASFSGLIGRQTDPLLLPRIGAGDEQLEFAARLDGVGTPSGASDRLQRRILGGD
jgi:peptidoglycan/xylan/chitin deacetylase (PgdA/CDA1 family)